MLGNRVADIMEGDIVKGKHIFKWNRENIESGIYFIKLTANNKSILKKLILTD